MALITLFVDGYKLSRRTVQEMLASAESIGRPNCTLVERVSMSDPCRMSPAPSSTYADPEQATNMGGQP